MSIDMTKENQEQRNTHWRSLVEEQQQSGLSQKEFCKQRNLSLSKFVYYRYQFKEGNNKRVMKASSFVAVKVSGKENAVAPGEIKVSLPNGFQCSFPTHLDSIQIKRLVEVLLGC
jgi:hypothetical protein